MADYLATNTPRLRFTQTGPRGTHRMNFRFVPGTTSAAALTAATPVLEAMMAFTFDGTSWASADWALEGSDVFLPVTWTPLTYVNAFAPVGTLDEYGRYLNFVGRTIGGSRATWYLFNVNRAYGTANNRLTPGESELLAPVLDALEANSPPICGIDQTTFRLKRYANSGLNDQVAKKSRALV